MMIELAGLRTMDTAPKDGTEIELLFVHVNNAYVAPGDETPWVAWLKAHWIDFNRGGWTWYGMAGAPIGWRPIK